MSFSEHVVAWPLLILNVAASVLVLMYAVQILASVLPQYGNGWIERDTAGPVAILVPAHDEEAGIGATLKAIAEAKAPSDRILVVADNCSDQTASIARAAGAEVLERHDPLRRGKGYALDAGIRHLALSPPAIVIIIDADCLPEPKALSWLARAAGSSGRPTQALYLMTSPANAPLSTKVSEFAFTLKNKVRQRGLHRLGLPCHLTGSGMAFPWAVINMLDLADGHLAEDMKMGLTLSLAGYPPQFCERAVVLSAFPETATGLETQRGRWINGHITLISNALRAIPQALYQGRLAAAMAAVATAIPPLTLFLLLLGVLLAISLIASIFSKAGSAAALLSFSNLTLAVAMTIVAWQKFGKEILPSRSAVRAVWLIMKRLVSAPLNLTRLRTSGWIRTDRSRSRD
ncbi:MAG: glycosyltransferase family 2 protein [Allorhizobium sp.]